MPKNEPNHLASQSRANDIQMPRHSVIIFYGRFSLSDLQDNSIDQQLRSCREEAKKHGQVISDEWVFSDEGVRGAEESRPELDRMLGLIRSGAINCSDLYIFDTSRLARDIEIAARLQRFFDYHKIRVHYVANGMVSGNPGFNLQHAMFSAFDQQFSATLGKHVRRGQIGQLEMGYAAMARCYGYDHVPDMDPRYADSFDARRRRGVNAVINPAQAEVVRMIFQLYRTGWGYNAIARRLNEMGIRSPRRPTRNKVRKWSTSSIRTILSNSRYTGRVRHGLMETTRHPESRKLVHQERDESEWKQYTFEDLRIISDEEFDEVQRIRASRDTLGDRRKTGGLNKAKGVYVFSGLLYCDLCGSNMTICQPDTYMCPTAYKHAGCNNKMKLNRTSLERDLMERLVRTVRKARSFKQIVDAVMAEVDRQRKEAEKTSHANNLNRGGLETKLVSVTREIDGLVNAIARHGHSDALLKALGEREAEKKLIGQQLDACMRVAPEPVERSEVEGMLSDALENLADILLGDPIICRKEIRKRIKRLVLTPSTFEGHPAYLLSGDIQLFSRDDAKMLGSNGSITADHFLLSLSGTVLKLDSRGKVLRITTAASPKPSCSTEGPLPKSPEAAELSEGDTEAIWREVASMDVEAFLAKVESSSRGPSAVEEIEWDDPGTEAEESSCVYDARFGGLRLAARDAASL